MARRFTTLGSLILAALLGVGMAQADERIVEVEMVGNGFQPQALEVTVGTTVRWVNVERRSNHDVYFPHDAMASGRLFPGESWERTFDEAGTFEYHCQPHENRGMRGVIQVVEKSAADDTPQDIDGYRSAEFGMSSAAVSARLEGDSVIGVSVEETDAGDLIIDGELRAEGEPVTDVRYVFPAGHDRLALVVAFHPHVDDYASVKERLETRYGQPWEDEMAEWWLGQLKDSMPQEPSGLTVWGGDGGDAGQRGRFVRLWSFEDYLSVEYLDTQLFR